MLEKIRKAGDVKRIPLEELPALADDIRQYIIDSVSKTGGHLASNLGTVELTIALHRVYNLPKDKVLWDVGHQAYTHKILTGRKQEFEHLRQKGGISGFPRREESPCDSFDTGHSSSSISCGLGYVKARELSGQKYSVVSVIGDGALTGGMAYEAMNNAANLKSNYVIVLNDNEMSISRNVGGISAYLGGLRTSSKYTKVKVGITDTLDKIPGGKRAINHIRKTKNSIKQLIIPGMFFEDMGITYIGPVDGHNIKAMIRAFHEAKHFDGAVLVHVITQKGKGYGPAQSQPSRFHGTTPFEIETGEQSLSRKESYTDVFMREMLLLGEKNPKVCAITAAMKEGTGLKAFAGAYPKRFFDVGIAEEHAVTFAAGLALGGMIPVAAVYSSFLQRAFDQLIHDVCMQNQHVVFAIDRAGLVGADGKTHQGAFDLSYLSMMPGMTVMAPKNGEELGRMLNYAVTLPGPVAIRYPRGSAYQGFEGHDLPLAHGTWEILREGSEIALLACGAMVQVAEEIASILAGEGTKVTLVNARFVKPLDLAMMKQLSKTHHTFLTLEENAYKGGFGEQVLALVEKEDIPVKIEIAAIPDAFIGHGTVDEQRKEIGLDAESLTGRVRGFFRNGDEI